MKKVLVICKVLVLTLLLCAFVFAQNPPNRENVDPRRGITRDDIVRGNLEDRMRNLRNSQLGRGRKANVYTRKRPVILKPEFSDELKQSLEIDNTTKNSYSDILSLANTGIVKIIAFENCKEVKKKKARRKCNQRNVNTKEFANAYSFRENKMAVFARSDLALINDYLVTGRHSVQTVLVDLGDVVLNDLNEKSSGISFLSKFKPSSDSFKMDEEHDMFKSGVVAGTYANGGIEKTYTYNKATKVIKDHTYAIRSIAYRSENSDPLEKDKDVLVIFRVVDKDKAGNITIVWKQLSKEDGMFMKFN